MKTQLLLIAALFVVPLTAMEDPNQVPQNDQKSSWLSWPFALFKPITTKVRAYIEQERLNRQFIVAARTGDTAQMRLLIQAGADLELRSEELLTPLMIAARGGHEEACKLLIDAGADLDASFEGKTALFYAALNGHESVCSLLIQAGANLNKRGYSKLSCFGVAVINNEGSICGMLLDAGCIIDIEEINQEVERLKIRKNPIHDIKSPVYDVIRTHAIFIPTPEEICASRATIYTALLCLKNVCPRLPKGPDKLILAYCEEAGNLSIEGKLKGKRVLPIFAPITEQALYNSTVRRLIKLIELHSFELKYAFGEAIQATVKKRLADTPLRHNGGEHERPSLAALLFKAMANTRD